MTTSAQDIVKLQQEIQATDKQLIEGIFLVVAFMIGSFIAAELSGRANLYKLVFVLAVTMVFWIARGDYLIHRAGAYIRSVEGQQTTQSGWETAKANLKSTELTFPIDLMVATGLVWMLSQCGAALVKLGETKFVWLSGAGVVAGILVTVLMVVLAQRRW